MPDRLLRTAFRLARDGYFVIPLEPGTKIPKKDLAWRSASSRSPGTIASWWRQRPWNVGIDCGKSHLVVVDCDVKHGIDGVANFERLTDVETLTVRTPTGGLHSYFQAPDGLTITNSPGRMPPGIDIRGVGGYVVAAGSRIFGKGTGVGGGWYSIDKPLPVAPLPGEVLELLRPLERPVALAGPLHADLSRLGAAALCRELERVSRAREGQRNNQLFKSSASLGQLVAAGALEREDVASLLRVAGMRTGLGEHECNRAIESGLDAGATQPRHLISMPALG